MRLYFGCLGGGFCQQSLIRLNETHPIKQGGATTAFLCFFFCFFSPIFFQFLLEKFSDYETLLIFPDFRLLFLPLFGQQMYIFIKKILLKERFFQVLQQKVCILGVLLNDSACNLLFSVCVFTCALYLLFFVFFAFFCGAFFKGVLKVFFSATRQTRPYWTQGVYKWGRIWAISKKANLWVLRRNLYCSAGLPISNRQVPWGPALDVRRQDCRAAAAAVAQQPAAPPGQRGG